MNEKIPILDKLFHIFAVLKLGSDTYLFSENVENYYRQELSKDEMKQLIIELQELIND